MSSSLLSYCVLNALFNNIFTIHWWKRVLKKSIAFVASTMPARYVANEVAAGRISVLYASSERLAVSYKTVLGSANDVKIVALPNNGFAQLFYIIKQLLKYSLKGRNIVFFHECCFMSLDIAIWICRPKGIFMPVSNLSTYNRLNGNGARSYFRSTKHNPIFSWFLLKIFDVYKQVNDGGYGTLYVPVIKRYPSSVKIDEVSARISRGPTDGVQISKSKSMLFLVGTDSVDSVYLKKVYLSLMRRAQECGYKIHIKDHPNPEMRCNITFSGAKFLDPLIPAELMDDCYVFAVGVASASLVVYGERGISIIEMLREMASDVRKTRKGYIKSISENVNFVSSVDEFQMLCKQVIY